MGENADGREFFLYFLAAALMQLEIGTVCFGISAMSGKNRTGAGLLQIPDQNIPVLIIDHIYRSFLQYIVQGYPEIVDFGVLEKYRRNGIGSRMMEIAEKTAAKYADAVYLGVGLHNGYGSAQRMYIKRGYIPDGSGVWYQDEICTAETSKEPTRSAKRPS